MQRKPSKEVGLDASTAYVLLFAVHGSPNTRGETAHSPRRIQFRPFGCPDSIVVFGFDADLDDAFAFARLKM